MYPDFTKPFILDTDASNEGIGAVLSQLDSQGQERVIAYGSRLLAIVEHNYCATRKELLAVVTFTLYFRPYTCWGTVFNYELITVPYNGFTEPKNQKDKSPDGWKNCSSSNLRSSTVRACVTPMPTLYPDCRVLSVALRRSKERKWLCCR